ASDVRGAILGKFTIECQRGAAPPGVRHLLGTLPALFLLRGPAALHLAFPPFAPCRTYPFLSGPHGFTPPRCSDCRWEAPGRCPRPPTAPGPPRCSCPAGGRAGPEIPSSRPLAFSAGRGSGSACSRG